MKKKFALIGLVLTAVLLTGCGKNSQPQTTKTEVVKQKEPSIIVLSKNEKDLGHPNIDQAQKRRLIYWIARDVVRDMKGHNTEYVSTRFLRHSSKYYVYFDMMDNKVIMKERIRCNKRDDCRYPRTVIKVSLLISDSEELRAEIEKRAINYLKEYPVALPKIKEAIKKLRLYPKISIAKNKYIDKKSLNSLSKKLMLRKKAYDETDLYIRYKKSGENLADFLSNVEAGWFTNSFEKEFGRYKIERFDYSISLNDYKQEIILSDEINEYIKFNYIPEKYKASDSKLSIELSSSKNHFYPKIINKTGGYVNLKAISIYYGEDVRTLTISKKLAPGTYNLKNQINIKNDFKKFKKTGQKVSFGVAIEYESAGKIYTLHKTKNFTEKNID